MNFDAEKLFQDFGLFVADNDISPNSKANSMLLSGSRHVQPLYEPFGQSSYSHWSLTRHGGCCFIQASLVDQCKTLGNQWPSKILSCELPEEDSDDRSNNKRLAVIQECRIIFKSKPCNLALIMILKKSLLPTQQFFSKTSCWTLSQFDFW